MALTTYAFIDITCTFTDPYTGTNINLGYGAGTAKEGIAFEMLEDKDFMAIGADGRIMHSLRSSKGGRLNVRLLKTSPTNNYLSVIYNQQALLPVAWGQNIISARDVLQGDVLRMTSVAFARQPVITYAEDGGMNEWLFFGAIDQLLGVGVPDLSAVA
jgi:hypothetical protein